VRIAGLDLLRGLAIGLVMLRHAAPGLAPGAGVVGVVMFFTLSGYLITGLLHEELERTGRVDLRRFYVRRARRLVPALLVLVAGVALVTLTLDPLGDRAELGKTVLVALTWSGNLPFGHASDATFHLWTLATEEQFYLLWPALLAVGFAARRTRVAVGVAAVVCALACVGTVVWLWEDPDLAYSLPTTWALCFVIGAATRLHGELWSIGPKPTALALAGLAALSLLPLRGQAVTYLLGGPAIAILTGALIISLRTLATVESPALKGVVWLGTVSYAAYLWNYPLTLWLRPHLGVAAGVTAAAATLVLAALSWRYVEQPVQSRPKVLVA
jgi:peptidoglycan/LPS O-acetylase OafA/YrhL